MKSFDSTKTTKSSTQQSQQPQQHTDDQLVFDMENFELEDGVWVNIRIIQDMNTNHYFIVQTIISTPPYIGGLVGTEIVREPFLYV